ncbi:acyltransferase family protein [Dysgonomonas sp. 511]|uniref:acyltransferase family protein n=1 Tax=Dysgonomonas sp. 511 TaxID=2302930 RepID=UPI0013D3454F|nr:acyltransferase family protein [Dysgonomonas sp. 511]NDV78385.1 hypothetical protein [Dysgonomonas sp. 511]
MLAIFLICYTLIILFFYRDNNTIMLSRFPLYCLGLIAGDILAHKKKIKKLYLIIPVAIGIVLLAINYWFEITGNKVWEYYTNYTAFFFLVPPACLLVSKLFSLVQNYKFPFLTMLGNYSLCIYIIHFRVLVLATFFFENRLLATISYLVFSIVLSYIWQNMVAAILNKYWKLNNSHPLP